MMMAAASILLFKVAACSMEHIFSIIWLDKVDPDYPVKIANEQNVKIYTSDFDKNKCLT